MKKTICIFLCSVLMVCAALGMTACSSDEKEPLIGVWHTQIDLTEQIRQEFAADEETAEYLNVDSFRLTVQMEFREDETFTMSVDEASVDEAIDGLITEITEGMSRYIEDLMYTQTGLKMTADEILESMGITMDELFNQMFPEESVNELKSQMISGFSKEGRFAVEEGRLFTSAGIDNDVDSEIYETYTLEGDVLTLLEYTGPDAPLESLYPMEFHREK